MDVVHSCRCCLRRAPDKHLMTPYTHLGTTEIYSDMLKECFEIHLIFDSDEEVGICDVCVGRLRDASDFKLQVQHSQVELQARLQEPLQIKSAEVPIKVELKNEDETSDGERQELLDEERAVKVEVSDDASSDEDCISPAWAGAADSRAPSRHGPRLASRMKDMPDDTAGLRAEEQAYPCGTCGEHFTDKSRLMDHVQAHVTQADKLCATYSCKTCSKVFSCINIYRKHVDAHMSSETFVNNSVLIRHVGIQTGVKPYSCNECHKQFTIKHHLDRHKLIHTGVKLYSCNKCEKRFTHKRNLGRHKLIHTEVKAYSCDECKKQFRAKNDLTRHERIHKGVKPYSCIECDKRFTSKQNLDIHRRIHTGEKPYGCDECNKQFRSKGELIKHVSIHIGVKSYSCKECDKKFTLKHHLETHKRIHTGVKPYSCDECNKQFRYKCNLIAHVRIHTRVN